MPVTRCRLGGKPGYKFGSQGKCYTYTAGNAEERTAAKAAAERQGAAIGYYAGEMVKLTQYVIKALEKGIKLHEQGLSGDGLQDETLRFAREGIESGEWPADKILKASAWFARHVADRERMNEPAKWDEPPRYSPAYVAWLLWGSDSDDKGRDYIDRKADELRERMELAESDPSTPAPPEDRIKGSEVNEPGSASADGDDIKLNEATTKALEAKVEQHNKEHTGKGQRVTLDMLKKVYRRGAGAYSTSHRPNVTRAAWAMARVNAFLKLVADGKPANANYITDNDLLPTGHPLNKEADKMEATQTNDELGYKKRDEEMAYDEEMGHDDEMMKDEEMAVEIDGDLHVMRLGPLHDLMNGELVIDLDEAMAKTIAENTQMMIDSGHHLPISFEHGIEGGQRGERGADRRPYGHITKVYYVEGEGIYASKVWSKLGQRLVAESMSADGESSLRVSPRVNSSTIYSPETGEEMGAGGVIDVVSLTTMPRQNRMRYVPMSRPTLPNETTVETIEDDNITGRNEAATPTTQERILMTEKKAKAEEVVEVLFARGSQDHDALCEAVGIEGKADAAAIVARVAELSRVNAEQTTELSRYRKEQQEREVAKREAEVDGLLAEHDLDEKEALFYRAVLLGEDKTSAELARNTLLSRSTPDPLEVVNAAIEEAKTRGAVAADFELSEKAVELAKLNPEVVVEMLKCNPDAAVVPVGEAKGSDNAGLDVSVEMSREDAAAELSRAARRIFNEAQQAGQNLSLADCHAKARAERVDLAEIVK